MSRPEITKIGWVVEHNGKTHFHGWKFDLESQFLEEEYRQPPLYGYQPKELLEIYRRYKEWGNNRLVVPESILKELNEEDS